MDDTRGEFTLPSPRSQPPETTATQPGALGAWWRQGVRTAFFMRPSWQGLQATPATLAWLVAALFGFGVLAQRLTIPGPATVLWGALQSGWLWSVVTVWVCWWQVPRGAPQATGAQAPRAAALFAMSVAQAFALELLLAVPLTALARHGAVLDGLDSWATWAVWGLPLAWSVAAQAVLVWRASARRIAVRVVGMLLLGGVLVLNQWAPPPSVWYADTDTAQGPEPMRLTQPMFEAQAQLLSDQLAAIAPQRPAAIDVYSITFAPYADEDVFLRESRMVTSVMAERFGAAGRTLQLVNHRETVQELPWATPLNLQRTIRRMAQQMDRDHDVLFIHLTSHGARSGQLAAAFLPLSVDTLTPQMLKGWLDEAGIRHRIVSVSACYSGSWIEPLAGEYTLVMTAADADHTSYGCGRKSPLTYFGRAMFDEQLRHTGLFEASHAEARRLIEQREKDAGKTDGFSNPQIRVGAQMREQLVRLQAQREVAGARP